MLLVWHLHATAILKHLDAQSCSVSFFRQPRVLQINAELVVFQIQSAHMFLQTLHFMEFHEV